MENNRVTLCPADETFFEPFYRMRCEPQNIYWTGHDAPPEKESLRTWFTEQLAKKTRLFFAICIDDRPVGYLYIDLDSDPLTSRTAEISYGVSSRFAGRGIATKALKEALALIRADLPVKEATLQIAEPNLASARVAMKAGFVRGERTREVPYAAAGKSFWLRRYRTPLPSESP